jgi:hypothetical protein
VVLDVQQAREGEKETDMLNLTPHPITLQRPDGSSVTLPPSGTLARVGSTEAVAGVCPVTGMPVITRTLGLPLGLPPENTPAIVSAMVLAACPGRAGLYAPDTGPTAIRDDKGHIIAVTRLVAA